MINIVWQGAQFINHSLAIVNRELELELIKNPEINLSIIPVGENTFTEKEEPKFIPLVEKFNKSIVNVDFTVRHQWPPDFSPTEYGKLIIIQPWEVGSMPKDWLIPFLTIVDQVWVPSNENRNIYIRDGIPEEKVKVIPNGVNPVDGIVEKFEIKSEKKFKFLFNGGTIYRKGIDLLLKAYTEEFSNDEDVCLVIKDIGIKNIYVDNFREEIHEKIRDKNNPEIIYLDSDLSDNEITGLYRSCDCYVHPYRGEGFGMTITEAMLNELPVIVTNYGSALDFCKPEFCYLVDYDIFTPDDNYYFDVETVQPPFYPEVKIESLKKTMRYAFAHQEEIKFKGKKASEFIKTNFTWKKSVEKILEVLKIEIEQPVFRDNPDYYSKIYHTKGVSLFESKDYKNSENYLKACETIKPEFAENIYYLGLLNYEIANYKASMNYLTKSISMGIKETKCFETLYQCLKKLGDEKTALLIKRKFLE